MAASEQPDSVRQGNSNGSPAVTAEFCFAIGLAALGLYVAWQGTSFGRQIGYMPVGPAAFPVGIGICLFLVSAVMAASAYRRGGPPLRDLGISWAPLLKTLGLFAAYLLALGAIGFLVATPLFFIAAARVLGSRHSWIDLAVGAVFAGTVFSGFRYGLGVRLPMGDLWPLLATLWG